jgi:hypothetical protein
MLILMDITLLLLLLLLLLLSINFGGSNFLGNPDTSIHF